MWQRSRAEGFDLPAWWIVLGLALVAGIAERQGVSLLGDRQRGIETPFVPPDRVYRGRVRPARRFLVAAISNLADFRRPYLRWAVYTPAHALTGAAAGLAASALISASALDALQTFSLHHWVLRLRSSRSTPSQTWRHRQSVDGGRR